MVYFMIGVRWCVFAFYHVCLQVVDVVCYDLVSNIIIVAMRGVERNMVGLVDLRKEICE